MIARILGFSIGGGMQVAIQTDIRITAESTQFRILAAKLGTANRHDGSKNLVSLVDRP
jgi:enoyl-CoA hydratase/carnithine racemase